MGLARVYWLKNNFRYLLKSVDRSALGATTDATEKEFAELAPGS